MRPTTVYRCFDDAGHLLYVGCSVDWPRRMYDHDLGGAWFRDVARVELQHFASAVEGEAAEQHAIKTEDPLHNKVLVGRLRTPQQTDRLHALRTARTSEEVQAVYRQYDQEEAA